MLLLSPALLVGFLETSGKSLLKVEGWIRWALGLISRAPLTFLVTVQLAQQPELPMGVRMVSIKAKPDKTETATAACS